MLERPTRRRVLGAGVAAGLAAAGLPASTGFRVARAEAATETVVYVANAGEPSIHVLAMNRATGDLAMIDAVAIPDGDKPSPAGMPLALAPDGRFLYAALRNEPFTAATFAIDASTGRLTHLGNAPLAAAMAYATVDRTGKWLLCASDAGGKVTVNPIAANGRVGAPPGQVVADRPAADCLLLDAGNRYGYCAVAGQDRILQLRFDPQTGRLSPNEPGEIALAHGAAPRRLALHPTGRLLFAIAEATAAIGLYAVNPASGTLKPLQSIDMLARGFKGEPEAADLHVTPDGRFLYASERRSNTLAGFRIDPAGLSRVGHYPTETSPLAFAVDPRSRFLLAAGFSSNHLTVYSIRQATGVLDPVKQHAMGKAPAWVACLDLR